MKLSTALALVSALTFSTSALPQDKSDAATLVGIATAVHDGDTFTIGKQKIRVFGIDAPELNQKCRADAILEPGPSPCVPCGKQARGALSRLIQSKELTCTKRGQSYDRMVAECTIGKLNIGLWMLSHGQAVSYPQFLKKRDRNDYLGAEASAKSNGVGLWSETFVPPEDWRRHRARLECERN